MSSFRRMASKGRSENFLCILGHVNIDTVYRVPRLPVRGLSINALSVSESFGGTAGNIAINAAALGVPTALGAYVGVDFSREYGTLLKHAGLDIYDLIMLEGYRTPRCHIFDDGEEQSYVIEQGAMSAEGQLPLWEHAIGSSDMLHVATGDPVRYRKAVGGRAFNFDPGQEISYRYSRSMLKWMISRCSVFFCNRHELVFALKIMHLNKSEELNDYCDAVICTLGKRGTLFIRDRRRSVIRPSRPRRIISTIGAGDAFRAGFYAALYHGAEIEKAVEMGNVMATIAIERRSGRTSWDELESRWEREYAD